jgi:HK97 family phage major capsid protein
MKRRKYYRDAMEQPTARTIACVGYHLVAKALPVLLVLIALASVAFAAGGPNTQTSHHHPVAWSLALVAGLAAAAQAVPTERPNIKVLRNRRIELKSRGLAIVNAAQTGSREFTAEERTELDGLRANLSQLDGDIDRVESFLETDRHGPVAEAGAPEGAKKPWASLGEQLLAVRNFHVSGGRTTDDRLYASLGANESVPAEGGFLVAPEYVPGILQRTYDSGQLASRCFRMPMGSNRIVMNAVDEDSRADGSRWGGIQAYWLNEGGTYTPSKPKIRPMQLVANKLIGLCYVTEEQTEDAPSLTAYINSAFPDEFSFKIDDAVLNGTGAGMPLGIITSNAAIGIDRAASNDVQTADILSMWSRMWARSRATSAWFINQDVEPKLYPLALANASGSILYQGPLYMPPGTRENPGQYGLLMGRPVIPIEQAASLGTTGDVTLLDLQQYLLAQKAGMRADSSIHVAFLTGEEAFRFMLRLDGQPMWKKPLTPKNGSNTLAPFVVLDVHT